MNYQHKELAAGRWQGLALMEQLANVGSEVFRALNWQVKNKPDLSRPAFERALELLGLTIDDQKNKGRLKELTRLQEALADYFAGENTFQSTPKNWESYFLGFSWAANLKKRPD